MPRTCAICHKGLLFGHTVSHANNKGPKRSFPNLKRVRTTSGGRVRRQLVCTRCIRSGLVTKAA